MELLRWYSCDAGDSRIDNFMSIHVNMDKAKDVPAGKPHRIVDVSELPNDRTFRNAWEYVQ